MISAVLATPLGRYALLALAIAAIIGGLYAAGSHHGANAVRAKDAKALTVAKADIATHEAKAIQISAQASRGIAAAHAAVAQKIAPLVRRIPVDVGPEADRDCRIPGGFVSLWNAGNAASADAGLSRPASGPQSAPADPPEAPTGG